MSSRRGRSVSELCVPRNQSESPLLDAQQHSGTTLAPVEHAPMAAAAHPPLPAPYSSASTAQMERASTETSCGSSAAAAIQAVIHTADPPALQSVSTTTPIPSGTDSPCPALTWRTGLRLCTYPHPKPIASLSASRVGTSELLPPPPHPGNTLACTLNFLPQ